MISCISWPSHCGNFIDIFVDVVIFIFIENIAKSKVLFANQV